MRRVTRVNPSSPAASRRMKATRGSDNPLERNIRSLLYQEGYRYFKHRRLLPGTSRTVDIVLPRRRLAIFIDGCFWHGCPLHGTWPKANAEFWREKIETNMLRDKDTTKRLRSLGWKVIRIWEHVKPEMAVKRIISILETDR